MQNLKNILLPVVLLSAGALSAAPGTISAKTATSGAGSSPTPAAPAPASAGAQTDRQNAPTSAELSRLNGKLLNRFDQLCRQYETKYGISRIENNFVRRMENAIHSAMQFPNYCYDYRWMDGSKDRKGPKLVLFLFEEFDSYEKIPEALCTILDACACEISQLEKKLAQPADKIIPLLLAPPSEQKEAA